MLPSSSKAPKPSVRARRVHITSKTLLPARSLGRSLIVCFLETLATFVSIIYAEVRPHHRPLSVTEDTARDAPISIAFPSLSVSVHHPKQSTRTAASP